MGKPKEKEIYLFENQFQKVFSGFFFNLMINKNSGKEKKDRIFLIT